MSLRRPLFSRACLWGCLVWCLCAVAPARADFSVDFPLVARSPLELPKDLDAESVRASGRSPLEKALLLSLVARNEEGDRRAALMREALPQLERLRLSPESQRYGDLLRQRVILLRVELAPPDRRDAELAALRADFEASPPPQRNADKVPPALHWLAELSLLSEEAAPDAARTLAAAFARDLLATPETERTGPHARQWGYLALFAALRPLTAPEKPGPWTDEERAALLEAARTSLASPPDFTDGRKRLYFPLGRATADVALARLRSGEERRALLDEAASLYLSLSRAAPGFSVQEDVAARLRSVFRGEDAPDTLRAHALALGAFGALGLLSREEEMDARQERDALFEKALARTPGDASLLREWIALAGEEGSTFSPNTDGVLLLHTRLAALLPLDAAVWRDWDKALRRSSPGKETLAAVHALLLEREAAFPAFSAFARARLLDARGGKKLKEPLTRPELYAEALRAEHPAELDALLNAAYGTHMAKDVRPGSLRLARKHLLRALDSPSSKEDRDRRPAWNDTLRFVLRKLIWDEKEALTPDLLEDFWKTLRRDKPAPANGPTWKEDPLLAETLLEAATYKSGPAARRGLGAALDIFAASEARDPAANAGHHLRWAEALRLQACKSEGEGRRALLEQACALLDAEARPGNAVFRERAESGLALCALLPPDQWGNRWERAHADFTLAGGFPAGSQILRFHWAAFMRGTAQNYPGAGSGELERRAREGERALLRPKG